MGSRFVQNEKIEYLKMNKTMMINVEQMECFDGKSEISVFFDLHGDPEKEIREGMKLFFGNNFVEKEKSIRTHVHQDRSTVLSCFAHLIQMGWLMVGSNAYPSHKEDNLTIIKNFYFAKEFHGEAKASNSNSECEGERLTSSESMNKQQQQQLEQQQQADDPARERVVRRLSATRRGTVAANIAAMNASKSPPPPPVKPVKSPTIIVNAIGNNYNNSPTAPIYGLRSTSKGNNYRRNQIVMKFKK